MRGQVRELMADAVAQKEIEIDLPNQVVIRESGEKYPFEVDPFKKHCLINGLDDIGLTMQKLDEIRAFEDPSFESAICTRLGPPLAPESGLRMRILGASRTQKDPYG